MATMVEDITLALNHLGGQAPLKDIYLEVERIRKGPLPVSWQANIRGSLEAFSSDSKHFQGKDIFKKMGVGVWALRDQVEEKSSQVSLARDNKVTHNLSSDKGKNEVTTTWVEDIVQALKILGGNATLTQIYDEVSRIRQGHLPKMWQHIIQDTIYQHSSDTQKFKGNDLFQKVGKGVWALRKPATHIPPMYPKTKSNKPPIQEPILPESFEEISNILRTIKQYRDYQDPNTSTWKDYVKEYFSVLGFSIEDLSPRLMTLNEMGANHPPNSLILFVGPGEDFQEIIPGISWESHLLFAANYYHVEWGILTNGLQLKIINFKNKDQTHPSYWPDFDGVILHEKLDTFFTIYKEFSLIKGKKGELAVSPPKVSEENGDDLKEWHELLLKFWGQLLTKAKSQISLHANRSPVTANWISGRSGFNGFQYLYVVRKKDAQVDLYIDRGDAGVNKNIFDTIYQQKEVIEEIFGTSLEWLRLDGKRACRIRYLISDCGVLDQEQWPELQDRLIDAMIRLEKAFRPFIRPINF